MSAALGLQWSSYSAQCYLASQLGSNLGMGVGGHLGAGLLAPAAPPQLGGYQAPGPSSVYHQLAAAQRLAHIQRSIMGQSIMQDTGRERQDNRVTEVQL